MILRILLLCSTVAGWGFAPPLQHPSRTELFAFSSSTDASPVTLDNNKSKIASIVFLVPLDADEIPTKFGSSSPVGNPTIAEAAEQLARKCEYFSDGQVSSEVLKISSVDDEDSFIEEASMLVAMCFTDKLELEQLTGLWERRRAKQRKDQYQVALECSQEFDTLIGPLSDSVFSLKANIIPWSPEASAARLSVQMKELMSRWNSDDFCLALMLFLNQFSGHEIDWVKHSIDATWEKGPLRNAQELQSMVSSCGDCVVDCVKDDTCRECLNLLTEIDTRDQVASYRTIVSFESKLLRDFSYCILQKNNIFNCDAEIPKLPVVKPISSFRGKPLTEEVAKGIMVGHLDDATALEGSGKVEVSWKVSCGANEAYDKFPSQNQLFYPANKQNLWYDPVFRVETLDGRHVWCKRHYRVVPQEVPGTFRFSVLDNGVTSDEFWTIVGVADDLSWVVFHYAGAAAAVGQRYLGGLVCTADGSLPSSDQMPEVWKCLRSAGIQPWELYIVDNDMDSPEALAAGPPPLDFYRNRK